MKLKSIEALQNADSMIADIMKTLDMNKDGRIQRNGQHKCCELVITMEKLIKLRGRVLVFCQEC